jgi:hypothetical protein
MVRSGGLVGTARAGREAIPVADIQEAVIPVVVTPAADMVGDMAAVVADITEPSAETPGALLLY